MRKTMGFGMTLKAGVVEEYKRRHDTIWPELVDALREAGVIEYHIFLAPDERQLFACLHAASKNDLDALRGTDVMRRWWSMMADIMETNEDASPVETPFALMFDIAEH